MLYRCMLLWGHDKDTLSITLDHPIYNGVVSMAMDTIHMYAVVGMTKIQLIMITLSACV